MSKMNLNITKQTIKVSQGNKKIGWVSKLVSGARKMSKSL
jgi:hypothetical protein